MLETKQVGLWLSKKLINIYKAKAKDMGVKYTDLLRIVIAEGVKRW